MPAAKEVKNARMIVIAGGIGAGKSVVSRILSAMGGAVYDCDSRAKQLMDNSDAIKNAIATRISPAAIRPDQTIDRQRLAEIVFSDSAMLKTLNGIVHSAVKDDILSLASGMSADSTLFVETAIPHESGIDILADEIWLVTAPEKVRVERVMARSGMTSDQVLARIRSQQNEEAALRANPKTVEIVNDGEEAMLPQIVKLL